MYTHTPTPWTVGGLAVAVSDHHEVSYIRKDTDIIAQCWTPCDTVHATESSYETRKANARFIVTACNAHEAMKEALLAAERALEIAICPGKDKSYKKAVLGCIDNALALADGKERTP